ncbi:Glyoxylate reductase [Fusarium oxysporum f. sp. albedinis]|nr:Glyoxylate reductase [Fusarium oxysporum f. sp. albedinis]
MNEGEAERGTKLNEVKRNLNGKYEPIILTTKILTSLPMVSAALMAETILIMLRHAPRHPDEKKKKTDRIGLYNLSWRLSVYNKLSVNLFTIILAISSMLAL